MTIGNHLPTNWTIQPIPELLFFQEGPGVRNWQFTDSGVKLLNVRNINFGKINLDATSVYISENEAYGKYAHFLVDAGDLVIASSGIVVDNFHNKIAFISEEHLPLCMNTSTIRFKVLDKYKFDINFFRVFLGTIFFKSQLKKLITGSAQLNFGPSHLKKIKVPVPPIDDQKRIAYLLGKVEGLIAQRKQHLQQLDDLLKSVFLEMFGDPVRNEIGWKTEPLGNLATIERGRFSPRPRNDPKFFNGQYPFIQTGDISRSNGRLREFTQTLNELGIKVSKEFAIGTIVIAIVGATIGETAILEIPTYAPDSVIGITPKLGVKKTEAVFIEFLLRFWKPVLRARAPEAARANINIETLRPLPIIWPEKDDRQKFAVIVEKVESLKSRYQQSLTDLENLYGALSQQAFKGELDLSRVPLPLDNDDAPRQAGPASEQQMASASFQLPEPPDSTDLLSATNRQMLIEFWLNAWCNHFVGEPFSATTFMDAAYQRLLELTEQKAFRFDDPDNGFGQGQWYEELAPFGTNEYEHIKQWIFESLATGKLKQSIDGNQIKILQPKRSANWGTW